MKRLILFVALKSEFPITIQSDAIDIQVIYTGVGKVNAAMSATEVLTSIPPEHLNEYEVINFGSAGAPSYYVGRLVQCGRFQQGDIDATPLFPRGVTPFDEFEFNTTEIVYHKELPLCITMDTFNKSPNHISDMEAYSLAKVCKYFNVPFRCYKYISDSGDLVDWEREHENGANLFIKELGIDI